MKKSDRIRKSKEFDQLINSSKYKKNKYFVIYYREKKELNQRFGVAVGTKIGNAVVRNKIKRQTKEIIREIRKEINPNNDYIIMIRKECLKLNYQQMKDNLVSILKVKK